MSSSSEFVALCRSQVALLTQGLGASLSAVYLTEKLVEGQEPTLVPVVAYPEATTWQSDRDLFLLPAADHFAPPIPSPADTSLTSEQSQQSSSSISNPSAAIPQTNLTLPVKVAQPEPNSHKPGEETDLLLNPQPIVVPLIHEDLVMGLLVTGREDRPWDEQERAQIDRIAHTLALACILDQRSQWLVQERYQQRLLQHQQRDILDNLLHQFRNPLTALRTFGKLLLKRFLPGDANREVAASIVRESDRLQELLQQFEQAIDLGEANLEPLSLNPAVEAWETGDQGKPEIVQTSNSSRAQSPQGLPLLPAGSFWMGQSLALEPCSVAAILEPLLTSATTIAQEQNLSLQADIPADLPLVCVNAGALREVLSNLIDNALKYTPSGGQIAIAVFAADTNHPWYLEGIDAEPPHQLSLLGIAISDTGPGIPPEDIPHIFERHYRGIQAATDIAGSGLGLAIVQDLLLQMHGKIQIFSPAKQHQPIHVAGNDRTTALGPGTTFVAWLPVDDI